MFKKENMTETSDYLLKYKDETAHDAGKFLVPYIYASEQINEVLTALALAQSEMSLVAKDEKNPFYDKDYATLASVISTSREPLTKNGLSLSQWIVNDHLISFLGHKSGQYMQSAKKIIVKDLSNAQSEGSGITYARRYSMMSILGLAPADDDDGNLASGKINIGDAITKLFEARANPHLFNIWKKHEPEWKKSFKREDMEKIIEVKEYLKSKFQINQQLSNDKETDKKEEETNIDPYIETV